MKDTPKVVRMTGPLALVTALLVAVLVAPSASADPTPDPTAEATPAATASATEELATSSTAEASVSVAAEAKAAPKTESARKSRGDNPPTPKREREKRRRDDRGKPKPPADDAVMCTLRVPAAPLTAAGLATPYQLDGDGCNEANADTAAFVEATIVDPATKALSVYRPLVIDAGTQPAAAPVPVKLPAGAVVGVWFGFQGDVLKLVGPGAKSCVNGVPGSPFGQFAYCNAVAFFRAAQGVDTPPLGDAADGMPCPTVRDFFVVDQDQSDNVVTQYRVTADGRVAQDNAANAGIGNVIKNGSDNGLLNRNINPALGCASFMAPDLTNDGAPVPSLALNELHAAQRQGPPVALVPPNDPMAQVNGKTSLVKTALYRAGVGQPLVIAPDAAATYCTNIRTIGTARLNANKDLFAGKPSPDAAMSLFDFMSDRLTAAQQLLGCPAP